MSTLSKWAAGYTDEAGWTSPTNLQGADDSTFCTWTSATRNGTAYITAMTYGFPDSIGSGDTINKVTVRVKGYTSHTGSPLEFVNAQLYVGTTAKGTPQSLTLTTNSANVWATFDVTGITYADLSDLRVRITGDRVNSTVSSTVYIDSIELTVDYTADSGPVEKSDYTETATASDAGTLAVQASSDDPASAVDAGALSGTLAGADVAGASESGALDAALSSTDTTSAVDNDGSVDEGGEPSPVTAGSVWIERW